MANEVKIPWWVVLVALFPLLASPVLLWRWWVGRKP